MKSLILIFFVGYAVKCDDTSYYVVEIPEEPKQHKQFNVYWNVPTIQCKSKRIPFTNLFENFGIIQNKNDSFRGESISILYDPGVFPALFKNQTSGVFKFRNGGVPQQGDLAKHLSAFMEVVEQSIPDPQFSGIGVIDFESWRPVFRQNFAALTPYKEISYQIERKLHWFWSDKAIQARARERFEESGRQFMSSTLSLARRLRPRARWGYYAYPYCYNMGPTHMYERCAEEVFKENDGLAWLWEGSGALFPSTYVSRSQSRAQAAALVRGRVREAARLAAGLAARPPILPYFWYKYRDSSGFLPKEDLDAILETLYTSNASGFVIWGSSNDVNTVDKCQELLKYTEEILGPSIAKYTKNALNKNSKNTTDYTGFTTWRPILKDHLINNVTSSTETYISTEEKLTRDNITQEIVQFVESEIKNNSSNIEDEKSQFISIRKNSLINLFYNLLVYGKEADKVFNTLANIANINQENVQNSSLVTTTALNEIVDNSSEVNIMAVDSITTKNPIDFSQEDQRTVIPLIETTSFSSMDTTNSTAISPTTIPPIFTTRVYPTTISNKINISLDDTSTTDKDNSLFEVKNETANILANFNRFLETLDTIDSSSNFEQSSDSTTTADNITQNLLETSITYDDVYDSLDNDTSQVDSNSSSTNPTHIYSILNILKKPVETIESNYTNTESRSEIKGFHSDKLFLISNEDEVFTTTEKIKDSSEGLESDSLGNATLSIIEIISKGGKIKPLSEISLTGDNKVSDDNVAFKENSLEEVTGETVPSTSTDRTMTTESGIIVDPEYDKDFVEVSFGVASTNGARQVVVLY